MFELCRPLCMKLLLLFIYFAIKKIIIASCSLKEINNNDHELCLYTSMIIMVNIYVYISTIIVVNNNVFCNYKFFLISRSPYSTT